MPTIAPNQDFRCGTVTYKEGQSYEVSEDDARYFQEAGWIGEKPETGKVQSIEIHDIKLGHSVEVN